MNNDFFSPGDKVWHLDGTVARQVEVVKVEVWEETSLQGGLECSYHIWSAEERDYIEKGPGEVFESLAMLCRNIKQNAIKLENE